MIRSALVTDGLLRKSLAIARSLGSRGIAMHVGETTRMNPAAFSRYTVRKHRYPHPGRQPDAYTEWLVDTLKRYSIDLYIPADDAAMEHAVRHRAELEPLCQMQLPPTEGYLAAADKGETMRLAMQTGVPCPATEFPSRLDAEALKEAGERLGYPLVIKPRRSSGSRGIRVVHSEHELLEVYDSIHHEFPWPILQEFVPAGIRYDVCLLYNRHSELRVSFVQKELRHFPVERGPSTAQESVIHPELTDAAIKLLAPLRWSGIAEVEFMVDPRDGIPKLMEINPRYWNSLYAATLAGVDFPWHALRLLEEGDIPVLAEYASGVRCRSLLPGDILHVLANKDRSRLDPPFWHGPAQGMRDDILSAVDPMPTIGFLCACARLALRRQSWAFLFSR